MINCKYCFTSDQLELQVKAVLALFTGSPCQGIAFHDSLSEYPWSKINLIKPHRKMNQINVKFNIKSFASSIEQIKQHLL